MLTEAAYKSAQLILGNDSSISLQSSYNSTLSETIKWKFMKKILIVLFVASLMFSCAGNKEEENQVKSQWKIRWNGGEEARFGLFIHWGLYAQPAGEWKGEEIPGSVSGSWPGQRFR